MTSVANQNLLIIDAKNRALRTFLQSLAVDVLVAVCLVLYNVFSNSTNWDSLDWKIIGFSLAKTVVVSITSFIMRRFLDQSSMPTPLPPAPQPSPSDPTPGDGNDGLGLMKGPDKGGMWGGQPPK